MLILLATGSEDQCVGVLRERVAEATALHLAVPHLAEQAGEPLEFVIDTCDRRVVEQLAEHPQCAAQPPDRDPRVVDRVSAAAKSEIAGEDVIDLVRHIAGKCELRVTAGALLGPGRM